MSDSVTRTVAASADDCERSAHHPYFDYNAYHLALGNESSSFPDWGCGVRFLNLPILVGAVEGAAGGAGTLMSGGPCG